MHYHLTFECITECALHVLFPGYTQRASITKRRTGNLENLKIPLVYKITNDFPL